MTATVAPPNGNQFGVLLAIFLVIAFTTCVVLWVHERRWDQHDAELHLHAQQLATLAGRIQSLADFLEVEINDAVDDSPEALQVYAGLAEVDKADDDTDEFPIAPDTEPMALTVDPTPAVQARRDAAWDQQRPTPAPRELMTPGIAEKQRLARAVFVEEQLAKFDFSGRSK